MTKTIFITGATSGIGEACAHTFAQKGYNLIITGRRQERLEKQKEILEKEYAIQVFAAQLDVREKEQVLRVIDTLPQEFRPIDILLNNAGLAAGKDLFELASMEDWEQMINTNVAGLLYVTKAVLPFLKESRGQIINIGSTAADAAYPGGSVYCATKAAVGILSEALRIELLQHKIKVTNIKPGAAETEFSLVRFKGDEQQAKETYAGYQPLTAQDIADTVLYCATLPPHVCINELTMTCTAQANSFFVQKDL